MIDVFQFDVGQTVVLTTIDNNKFVGSVCTITTAIDSDSDYDEISIETKPNYVVEFEANRIKSIEIVKD